MALSDLVNFHYDQAVTEEHESFKMGRADNEVGVGDIIEMLLSISFDSKDAVLGWE